MNKEELKELAESLGIEVDGRWSEKRLKEEIAKAEQPEAEESEAPEREPEAPQIEESAEAEEVEPTNPTEPAKHIESSDLLRMMAEQRKKTGKLNPYARVKVKRRRKVKIHSEAIDKAE